ncbi:unnamed protein product [Diamesa hyperborea]
MRGFAVVEFPGETIVNNSTIEVVHCSWFVDDHHVHFSPNSKHAKALTMNAVNKDWKIFNCNILKNNILSKAQAIAVRNERLAGDTTDLETLSQQRVACRRHPTWRFGEPKDFNDEFQKASNRNETVVGVVASIVAEVYHADSPKDVAEDEMLVNDLTETGIFEAILGNVSGQGFPTTAKTSSSFSPSSSSTSASSSPQVPRTP